MQEDTEGMFDALPTLSLCLAAMEGMTVDMTPDLGRLREAAGAGYATAPDRADWLVRGLGVPFGQAHHLTGRAVALAAARGVALEELCDAELRSVDPRIGPEARAALGVENSVRSRTSYGGTAPENVRRQAQAWLARLQGRTGSPAAGNSV